MTGILGRMRNQLRGRRGVRLTGVSTLFGGVQWDYTKSERDLLRRLVDFLETRRVLWMPFNSENHRHVVESVLLMRSRLVDVQEQLRHDSPAKNRIRLLRLACERFLTSAQGASDLHFYSDLGELRGVFGAYLDDLLGIYGLDASPQLRWILPSTPAEELPNGLVRTRGEIERSIYVEPLQRPRDEEHGSEESTL
ncbi:DUF6650 family protein [Micromonospora sp. AP08]|uniref:DUF6650 family protein n=1 Tax=Micromonospora sp. AP08 TaxID=2604467 RepID=UPI003519FC16